ncbi:hypothetical protein SAMN05216559_0278 [Halomicrobium zhouii]|uniref:DUF8080 domain-containing protein n=1 Tax=Halomicrobium zhouii TaxID=767519 RepID=A0A1I6K6M6_9EURY|nr:hypothetical protein [Halomicrobium zhouii]SFR86891.1 hypothetical protein SAMN05216559_0278 [Halomicrobium zhouii]
MVSLTCDADHRDGVTLVTVRLDGAGVAQRVRLTNRLDGPVWPPRRHGVPAAGWNDDGFETVVPADGVVAVGYASPAPAVDAPVAVVDREIVEDGADEEPATAADALRDLGDPSPPRDAVPVPVDDAVDQTERANQSSTDQTTVGHSPPPARDEASVPEPEPSDRPGRPDQHSAAQADQNAGEQSADGVPAAAATWLDDVEERVVTAERLAAAETVPEATAAMRATGGLDDAEALVERLQQERAALESVAERADELAERTAAADVPLETLERLA